MTDDLEPSVWTLRCAQVGCNETATHVAVQPHNLAMLFNGGAAVCCYTHGSAYGDLGAVVAPLESFVTLAREGRVQ